MSTKNTTKSGIILDRLKEGLGLRYDRELCEKLGINQTTLSGWRTRGSLDYNILFANCDSISIGWLVTGEGPMHLDAKSDKQYNALGSETLDNSIEGSEMDWNYKMGKILENAPKEVRREVLGVVDEAYRDYGQQGKDKSSKQAG